MWMYFSVPLLFIIVGFLCCLPPWRDPRLITFGWQCVLAGLIGLVFSLSGHYFPLRR